MWKTIDLFAGIGGIRLGFDKHGFECAFSSEWDADAQAMYLANFDAKPFGDITKIHPEDVPDHDVLLGGFPCQPFSIIGKSLGFADTRGTLFFNIEEIIRVKRPKAFLLENVKQLKSHDKGRTLAVILRRLYELGYFTHIKVLNALDFGLPQKRERVFIVGFRENHPFKFPNGRGAYTPLESILESDEDIDPSLFASPQIVESRFKKVRQIPSFHSIWHENKGGNVSPLPYSCALRAGASYNYLLVNGKRRLSSREMLRLQGFPEDFKIVVNYQAMRKLTGNSVAVPVIDAIAQEMARSLMHQPLAQPNIQLQLIH